MKNDLTTRYRDGYRVAKYLTLLGRISKIVAYILSGLTLIIVTIASLATVGPFGFFLGLLIGGYVFFTFFVMGVIISASGQWLLSTLDIAVNTSPFMDNDQKVAALGFARIVFSDSNNTTNDDSNDASLFDGPTISCPYCQTKVNPGTRFCTGCGEKMP